MKQEIRVFKQRIKKFINRNEYGLFTFGVCSICIIAMIIAIA
jgi:hypothetical protein